MTKIQQTLFASSLIIFSTSVFAVNDTTSVNASVPVSNYTGVDARNMTQSYNNAPPADLSKAVGQAWAPALVASSETCAISTSGGLGFSGASISFGTTFTEEDCKTRLLAREIFTFGDGQAAKEVLCDLGQASEAWKRVGRPCYKDGGRYNQPKQVSPVQANQVVITKEQYAILQELVQKKQQAQSLQNNQNEDTTKEAIIFKR